MTTGLTRVLQVPLLPRLPVLPAAQQEGQGHHARVRGDTDGEQGGSVGLSIDSKDDNCLLVVSLS